jgi:3,2-trans-enoyl-CoA isomerase
MRTGFMAMAAGRVHDPAPFAATRSANHIVTAAAGHIGSHLVIGQAGHHDEREPASARNNLAQNILPAGGAPPCYSSAVEYIQCEHDNGLLIVSLARGKANALNHALVEELNTAVAGAAADPSVRGVVLGSANPRFFSSGFDVREVFAYDRDGMAAFFGRFIDLYESLYRFPKPLVAALGGHTFAGGAILAIACDVRIMADGDFGFALNEIDLGMAVSPGIRRMLVGAVGIARAREILLFGERISPARALEIGLVRELAPAGEVRGRAIACARLLASKPPAAYREIKRSLREFGGADEAPGDRSTLGRFLDMWFSAEAQECRRVAASRL